MKLKKFQVGSTKLNIYPLVCWHIGAKQSSETFIDFVVKTIKSDPNARWIYMGDAGECVTKNSKGNIYEQLLSPGDQLRVAADLLAPIADKGLFGIRGNHGNRVDKEAGVGWDEMFCSRVGIPYMGVSALVSIGMKNKALTLYAHHGSASAISPGGKMSAAHKPEMLVDADIVLTAHTHACGEAWPQHHRAYLDRHAKGVRWKSSKMFVCGSAYDSRSGYAEEKMYPSLTPEHIVVQIREMPREFVIDGKKIYLSLKTGETLCL